MVDDAVRYELLVQSFLKERIGHEFPGVRILHDRKYTGRRTGHKHQIDLSFELDIGGTSLLFLVECKKYKRRVGIDELLEFAQRLDDIGAHKGIVVTTAGFEEGALKVAQAHRIALIVADGRTYRFRNRMNVPSDLLTEIVRENELACYLAWASSIPPDLTLSQIDQGCERLSVGPLDFGKSLHFGGLFSDLDEVYGLCDFDEWVRVSQGVELPESEYGPLLHPPALYDLPSSRVKRHVDDMYGPGVLHPWHSLEGVAFELVGHPCTPVLTARGLFLMLRLEVELLQQIDSHVVHQVNSCSLDDKIFKKRFNHFADKVGWPHKYPLDEVPDDS